MDILAIINDFKARTRVQVEECGDSYLIMPFFHRYSTDSVTLRFFEREGDLCVSDNGDTLQYMYDRYVDVEKCRNRIEQIKKRFCLAEGEHGAFEMKFPSEQTISVEMFIGFYLQALTLLANLDIE